MAAKKNKSQLTFDIGTPEEVWTCASCHTGGGPYEYDRDGNRLDEVDPNTVPPLDGDYYSYTSDEVSKGTWGKPHKFDWRKTGSLEADCMTCHLDPDTKRVTDATGIKVVTYNPRLRIFAKRKHGKVTEVSLGIYPAKGWESAFTYFDPLSRSKITFEPGKYYADLDNPHADSRNYMRAPFVEGEGEPYSWLQAKRKFLGHFFRWAPSAGLMGWDNNGDGYPVTYVKIVKKGKEFVPEVYYEVSEFDEDGAIEVPMLSSRESESGDHKWTRVCGQCHVGFVDPINKGFNVRTWGLGMKADIVKRGEVWNLDPQSEDEVGYDVHAAAGFECTTCHAKGKPEGVDWEDYVASADHNFRKGHDSGNTVRDDLDNNPPPRNCYDCHIENGDGPDPTEAHENVFGSAAAKHVKEIACQTCHTPEIRYWSFRTFDYSLGFSQNFDNRHFPGPDGKMMEVQMAPYYGPVPFYGMGNVSWLVGERQGDGFQTDLLAPVAYMHPENPNDMYGQMYQHMTGKKDFTWVPPLYYWQGARGVQIMVGNPITVITWFDRTLGKILYARELNAAVKKMGKDKQGRTYMQLITGEKIFDKTGYMGHPDMKPEISTLDDVRKMRKALQKVLKKEGEKNPDPALYIAAHYFKISHNVLPASHALGANGTCTVCHGKNGRIEDRIVTFTPNSIEGFEEGVKQGLIIVDPEIHYVKPLDLDGDGKADVLGAHQKEILEATREHLEHHE